MSDNNSSIIPHHWKLWCGLMKLLTMHMEEKKMIKAIEKIIEKHSCDIITCPFNQR